MSDAYADFLASKAVTARPCGLVEVPKLHDALFPHQRVATEFALRVGRSALFLDTGLGKTLAQLEWARVVHEHTGGDVLILAPLAVAAQTAREGAKFGIEVTHAKDQECTWKGINITNYDRVDKFDPAQFAGIVLDESSILKSFNGKTRNALTERFAATPWRLCCTATPAPNDHMELGNHAEFLGAMHANEMLSRWFVNDTSTASQSWRLKGHAKAAFWDWVSSWACCVSRPSDLGFSDDGFALPEMRLHKHVIEADISQDTRGMLFRMPSLSATAMHREKKLTMPDRADLIAGLVAREAQEPWIIWCDTNAEADALMARIPDAIEVRGSEDADGKERKLLDFTFGRSRVLVTKPSIAGHGMNWQHCARMAFVGLSFSYERFYQAVRRCWRFGQSRPVDVHVAMANTEHAIWDVIARKSGDHDAMKVEMLAATKRRVITTNQTKIPYVATHSGRLPAWIAA